jgi:hypothetical protein
VAANSSSRPDGLGGASVRSGARFGPVAQFRCNTAVGEAAVADRRVQRAMEQQLRSDGVGVTRLLVSTRSPKEEL